MREFKIGDRVKVVKAGADEAHVIGLEGTVSGYGLLFDLKVTLDAPVLLENEVFNDLLLDTDEVELING